MTQVAKQHTKYGNFRTVTINGEVWFIAKDVCKKLGLQNTTIALRRLNDADKQKVWISKQANANIINAHGLLVLCAAHNQSEMAKWLQINILPDEGGDVSENETITSDKAPVNTGDKIIPIPQIYDNDEFGSVRIVMINNEPWFIGNDVAKALGYSNPSKATNDHCKKAIRRWGNDSLGRQQEFKLIPESDVYRLIVRSKLPSAEKFENWVFEEVLPSIRKTGKYEISKNDVTELDIFKTLPDDLKNQVFAHYFNENKQQKLLIEKQKEEIAELTPKADKFDQFMDCTGTVSLAEAAKLLGTGRNRFMDFLRDMYILTKNDNLPRYEYIQRGYFIAEVMIDFLIVDTATRVTAKGMNFLYELLMKYKNLYGRDYHKGYTPKNPQTFREEMMKVFMSGLPKRNYGL